MTSHEDDYWSARNSAEEQLENSRREGVPPVYKELSIMRAQAYAQLAQAAATMHSVEQQ